MEEKNVRDFDLMATWASEKHEQMNFSFYVCGFALRSQQSFE